MDKKVVYRINGVEYPATGPIPDKYKEILKSLNLNPEEVKPGEVQSGVVISPLDNKFPFQVFKFAAYLFDILDFIFSIVYGLFIRYLLQNVGININIFLTIAISILISYVAHRLALLSFKKTKISVFFSNDLSLIERFFINGTSNMYSMMLNLLFYIIYYLITRY